MNTTECFTRWSRSSLIFTFAALLIAGCQSKTPTATKTAAPAAAMPAITATEATTPSPSVAAPMATPAPVAARPTIRIDTGSTEPYTNSAGEVWLPDQGFADGDTVERDNDMQITNTTDAVLYRTEHYGMTSFSDKIPNGKYTVKLHFCETYDGITGPGQRLFSFTIGGHEFKDFDVWVKAGGPQRAYIETVDVDVTDGKLDITFTPNMDNPEINGIEIIPNP